MKTLLLPLSVVIGSAPSTLASVILIQKYQWEPWAALFVPAVVLVGIVMWVHARELTSEEDIG